MKLGDLAHCVIRDERTMIDWSLWFAQAGVPPVTCPGASFTDPTLCLEAAIAGHGVMLAWNCSRRTRSPTAGWSRRSASAPKAGSATVW